MAITLDIQEVEQNWLERKWPLMSFMVNPGGEIALKPGQWIWRGDTLFLTPKGWEVVKEVLISEGHSHVCSWNIFALQLWQRWRDEAKGLDP